MFKIHKQNKGFTLIEILVVIGIIAILAAIVLIALNPARQFALARQTQRTSNVNAILNAIGQHIADNNGEFPTSLSVPQLPTEINTAFCDELVHVYIPSLPVDPKAGDNGDGQPFTDCSLIGVGEVQYEVEVDAVGRVSVCAPLSTVTDEPALPGAINPICVTR